MRKDTPSHRMDARDPPLQHAASDVEADGQVANLERPAPPGAARSAARSGAGRLPAIAAEPRHGGEQHARVVGLRRGEDPLDRARFHQPSRHA